MTDRKIRRMVLAAALAALSCVATMVVQIPSPMDGYVNLGDGFVLLSGWLLGPWYGAAAGGIGSMLADVFSGYAYYAPATLVIKALVALLAGWSYRALRRRPVAALLGGAAGEAWMVLGYFGYAALILGNGLSAAASILGNLVQGAVGLTTGLLLLQAARRFGLAQRAA